MRVERMLRVQCAGFRVQGLGFRRRVCQYDVALPEDFPEREFFIDNLLVRIHFIIVMIR